ncbi:hypothetical protein T459_07507 [Capsicum annuum]|uniref:Uncharacterized protein n=1 Tax=Capsicum annuum TaxID=4072 RepID=A0A2G2ZTY1_CAPAN|nr:hypothetical protein T459_07507 [Capsicum annuum]
MAKTKPGKKDLDSYNIKGTNRVVRPGDCVLMRPSDSDKPPYVAKVEKLEADHRNNVKMSSPGRAGGVGVPHRWVKGSLVSLHGLEQSSPHELAFEIRVETQPLRYQKHPRGRGKNAEVTRENPSKTIVCGHKLFHVTYEDLRTNGIAQARRKGNSE